MTYKLKSEFLHIMQTRGFLKNCTDIEQLDKRLMHGCLPAYIGFDATADSLHVGSLIQIMMLHWLQQTGHQPIVLLGGGTTKIGDPSGKDKARQLLHVSKINNNIKGIRQVFRKYLNFDSGNSAAIVVNNARWLDDLKYIEFLRTVGKHFTINRMIAMDSVKSRLNREQPLSFLEFNYMLLQAYDFMQLNQRHNCILQMGGSDQWGNIVGGVAFTRRISQNTVYGLTSPLLTKADGSKMGKTASGAIWLNKEKLNPYDFWQFWRNIADADVGQYLKLFTKLNIAECERLAGLKDNHINDAKIILANHITALCHGKKAALAAEHTAKTTFEQNQSTAILSLTDLPTVKIKDRKISFSQALVRLKLTKTGKKAKRLIIAGGGRINNKVVTDPNFRIILDKNHPPIKISAGKKRHGVLKAY